MERPVKAFLKKNAPHIALAAAFGVFVLVSYAWPFPEGRRAAENFADFFIEFALFIPFMFILIGLFDVWFPKSLVERHIGRDSGVRGIFWVTLLGLFQAGPLYGAFPVAYALWKKGASPRNIFIYLGSFSALKLPMLLLEAGFLGLKFTLLRTLLSLPLSIASGFLLEALLKKGGFAMRDPEAPAKEERETTDKTDETDRTDKREELK